MLPVSPPSLVILVLCLLEHCFTLVGSSEQRVPVKEVTALRRLYENLNGENWYQFDDRPKWNFSLPDEETHPCRPDSSGEVWQRVTCANQSDRNTGKECTDDNCTIVALDFDELHPLIGIVPSEISYLESLRSLELIGTHKNKQYFQDEYGAMPSVLGTLTELSQLRFNQAVFSSGSIPDSYSQLKKLHRFHLVDAGLVGAMPPVIKLMNNLTDLMIIRYGMKNISLEDDIFETLTSLVRLTITHCDIAGTLPLSLQNLTKLEYLDLEDNQFTSLIHDFSLPNLREMDLSDNKFNGTFPFVTGNLKSLEELYLARNMLSGSIPHEISRLESMEAFRLPFNQFNGSLPDAIGSMTTLKRIELTFNQITGPVPTAITKLMHLQHLELQDNKLTSTLPMYIGNMLSLSRFRIFNNKINGSLPLSMCDLSELRQMYAQNNRISSSLPADFSKLTKLQFFHASDNYLTGSLPTLQNLQSLIFLNVSLNYMTGTVPSSLCTLPFLQDIEFQNNFFTSTLPECVGDMSNLRYLRLEHNHLSGRLPESLGNMSALIHLNLADNSFLSTIPSSLAHLSKLIYLYLSKNALEGTLPQSLIMLSDTLQDLDVGSNNLVGTIPSSLGNMSKLVILTLSSNYFTGTLPTSLEALGQVRIMQIDGNQLTGRLDRFFSPELTLPKLQIFDASDNAFTGELPRHLFANIPLLNTVALSLNCLSGPISGEVCQAENLTVLSLDGTGSSSECNGYGGVFLSYFGPKGLTGSIPACLLEMPSLLLLHMSANALSGKIPDQALSPSLRNISLSHNHLTSTIPLLFQQGQLDKLDLSHNKLTGEWEKDRGDLVALNSSHLDGKMGVDVTLTVNRLSGDLPSPLPLPHIDVLRGNLFGCGFSLPEHDPSRSDYSCGSSQLDDSLYFLAGGGGCLICVLAIYGCYRGLYFQRVSNDNADCKAHVEDGGALKGVTSSANVKWNSNVEPFEIDLSSTDRLGKYSHSHGPLQSILEFVSVNLSRLSPGAHLYCFLMSNMSTKHLENLYSFHEVMIKVIKVVTAIMILGQFLSLPLYILKATEEGRQSYDFTTHTFSYGWLVSAAFVTGYIPSLLVLVAWTVVVFLFLKAFWLMTNMDDSPFFWKSGDDQSSNPMHEQNSQADAVNSVCVQQYNMKDENSNSSDTPRMWVMFALNVIIVGTVNGLYIYSTLHSISTDVRVLIQYAVALFKIIWDVFMVPTMFRSATAVYSTRARLKLLTLMFNSIVVPCAVTMCTSPVCFRDVFVPPQRISSTYTITICELFSYAHVEECDHYVTTVEEIPPFYPPFSYNYLCGSIILSSYIPVFLYAYSFLLLLPVMHWLIILFVPPPKPDSPGSFVFSRSVKVLPGILWPKYWSDTCSDMSNTTSVQPSRQSNGNDEKLSAGSSNLTSSRQLLKPDDITATLMGHIAVMLTFGIAYPALAVVVGMVVCVQSVQWIILLNRFIFKRIIMASGEPRELAVSRCSASIAMCIQGREPPIEFQIPKDASIRLLNDSVRGFRRLMSICVAPVLFISCMFIAFFTWDMAADRLGFIESIWLPALAIFIPLTYTLVAKSFKAIST